MSQKKNAPKEKRIPIAKMQEGIDLSLKKSMEHLDGAEALISKKLLNGSVALIEFAIEEFGRAVILRNMFRNNLETIEQKSKWKNHNHKYKEAFTVLSTNLQTIWEKTFPSMVTVGAGIATAGASAATIGRRTATIGRGHGLKTKKEMVSHDTRCNAIFVDFVEDTQKWRTGTNASSRKLEYIIGELKGNIKNFKV
jgi:AbiV family abortive infection protein